MMKTSSLRWAAAAVLLFAPAGAFAKDPVRSAGAGVRSAQALPPMTTPAYRGRAADVEKISDSAAASPAYCSGNKYGLYNGQGYKHANGMPFTCGKSPG